MPPLATWYRGREAIGDLPAPAGRCRAQWRWRHVPARANGQAALGFYSWDAEAQAYLPFALNVLTLRGEQISDVTAFITRTPPETDDRETYARRPEQPADPLSSRRRSQRFGVPTAWTDAPPRQDGHGRSVASSSSRALCQAASEWGL